MTRRPSKSVTRSGLLLGVSTTALLVGGSLAQAAGSNPYQRGPDPAAQAAQAAINQASQAAFASAAGQRALAAMAQAAATRNAMNAGQIAARAAAAAAQLGVPDGLGAGGLDVDPGVGGDPSLWLHANAPTQSTGSNGRVQVTVQQTDKQAILNWRTFNVGLNTDLSFDQQGNASWVALNRVNDPAANPTQILGTIKAPGTVLVLNRNGVIFGGASQVNVGALVAGAATITDSQFLTGGIYSSLSSSTYTPSFTGGLGQVQVQAGAQLTTNAATSVLQGGGYVMLLGGSVENDGSITTPMGQALLAAGDSFDLRPGLGTTANQYSTTRGSEVAPIIAAASANGQVSNKGSIYAQQGDITLAGRTVVQGGVALSTSSVNQRGTIHLLNSATDGQGSVTLTGDSYTAVLPELDSTTTALDGQRAALIADSVTQNQNRLTNSPAFDDLSKLADREDQSRIEIVTGGNVEFQGGSLTQAQGGQVAVQAAKRIQVDAAATIDVSGVQNVALNVSDNNIMVNIQGNELRDSAANRDSGALFNSNVWVDANDLILVPAGTGGSTADRYYTAGGLIEVSGYLGNVGHTIGEWDAVGGTITLSAAEVVAQTGSLFNVSGGSLAYQGGMVRETLLQGSDGRLYTADNAPADLLMVSVGQSFQAKHDRWGDQYTQTWQNPFTQTTTTTYVPSYIVGRDGGQLILSSPTVLFDGTLAADVIDGLNQTTARPANVTDPYTLPQTVAPLAGGLSLGQYVATGLSGAYATDVQFDANVAPAADGLGLTDKVSTDRANTAWFDAGQISSFKLGELNVTTSGDIAVNAPLTLANGGQAALTGASIDINADITARSGAIKLSNFLTASQILGSGTTVFTDADTTSHIDVAPGVTMDLRGLWTNVLTDPDTAGDLAFVDGGDFTIDGSQNVTIGKGAVIDVSSGGGILANRSTKGGAGGNVTLIAGDPVGGNGPNPILSLDGVIHAEGVTGGGTLTISEPGTVLIGPDASLSGGVLTLAAGTPAHVNLTLAAPLTIPAGMPLPLAYSATSTQIPLDTPLTQILTGADPRDSNNVSHLVTQAPWVVPAGASFYDLSNGGFNVYFAGTPVPVGTTVSVWASPFPAGTVIPSAVFPNGFATRPYSINYAQGATPPTPITYAPGTVIPAGTVFSQAVPILPVMTLDPGLFQSGFTNYVINGGSGLEVSAGTAVQPEVPVYQILGSSQSARSGADPASAMTSWLPPLFIENPLKATLTQRVGASLSLTSNSISGLTISGGAISVPDGASVTVDPGQSIKLDAYGQITVDGALTAHGGSVTIYNESAGGDDPSRQFRVDGSLRGTSIWLGENGLIDVSGEAYTAVDQFGRTYGVATNGGSVSLGNTLALDSNQHALSTQAFIILRPGSEIDADGAQVTVDRNAGLTIPQSGGPQTIATNGGSIAMNSFVGLYLDGGMHAAAGGPGAAGGSLNVTLETPIYSQQVPIPIPDVMPTVMNVVQARPTPLDEAQPGFGTQALTIGQATVSADMISAGGFANVTLDSRDMLQFNGDVTLKAAQSITLVSGAISSGPLVLPAPPANSTPVTGHTVIQAPYVLIDGQITPKSDNTYNGLVISPGTSASPTAATFEVDADDIDLRGPVTFSAGLFITTNEQGFYQPAAPGFKTITLNSTGDIRVLAEQPNEPSTFLQTPFDLNLIGAQIYPTTGTSRAVISAKGVLTIGRSDPDVIPDTPVSAFGSLVLTAPVINQGGIVRAPLGTLTLGVYNGSGGSQDSQVNLLPGSITSVSGAGMAMPYGGTPDGINYNVNGSPILITQSNPGLTIDGSLITVMPGAVVDVSGGGNLAGAAFIPGRGGSVDVLKTPLINANPKTPVSAASDKVYAILPGYDSSYAPISPETGAGNPGIGQQITVPAGVPGLPPGTYTLLPSNFALLPGAFRIEIGKAASIHAGAPYSIGNGTYAATGYLGVANTGQQASLPSTILVTSGTAVRDYSQYDEEGYADFITANLGTLINTSAFGSMPPLLPQDARSLNFVLETPSRPLPGSTVTPPTPQSTLTFNGTAITGAATGGVAATVSVTANGNLEVDGGTRTDGFNGLSVDVASLDNLHAPSLVVKAGGDLTLRPDLTLAASQVILSASGNIDIGQGATVTTIGQGDAPATASLPQGFSSTTLALSNSILNITGATGTGAINIEAGANLFAGGTLALATNGPSTIDPTAHFGAQNIALAVASINIGSAADIAAAHAPAGLAFDQSLFNLLIAGDPTHGAPALESLTLTAGTSINVFGSATLDASGTGVDLVLNTPAIYGVGGAGDHAAIIANTISWNGLPGVSASPTLAVGSQYGQGTLDLKADEIDFGQFNSLTPLASSRTIYGFGTVNLTGQTQIVTASTGSLSVFQSPGSGGNLNIVTPLLTGVQKSVASYTAGGAISVSAPAGVAPSTATSSVGGSEIDFNGDSVSIDTTILLPSGKLVVNATHDIDFGPNSRIDLAGQPSTIQSATVYGFGGVAQLESAQGSINQAVGGLIDVSAVQADAGSVSATAYFGTVNLAGELKAAADAGFTSGDFTLTANVLPDFAALNASLTAGGFFDQRKFDIKTGDLTIGDGVKARDVEVSLDGGALTVAGTIDASGVLPGTIRLAGKTGLTLESSAVLDAHGTELAVDSYGQPIDAKNRGEIELQSPGGRMTLASGATIDLSNPDGVARGELDLDVRRTGETSGDADIDASGPLTIKGAGMIAVNAFWTYAPTDAYGTIVQDNGVALTPGVAMATLNGQGYLGLAQVDNNSQIFMNAAVANASLLGRLQGLRAYADAFHLRPGVEIDSSTPDGKLTIAGDIDLSGYRYASLNPNFQQTSTLGSGEPGALVIRAGGDLDVAGSISDGFAAAPTGLADDNGWFLLPGAQTASTETLLALTLNGGTSFPNTAGLSLRFAIPINASVIKANVALPVQATLSSSYTVPAGTRLAAPILDSGGAVLYPAGTVFSAATTIPAGSQLAAGTQLPTTYTIAAMTWPAGTPLDVFFNAVSTSGSFTVPFEGIIPTNTNVQMSGASLPTRPTNGSGEQGSLYAVAPMLPQGDLSWSLRLVAGADLGAADTRIVKPASLLKARGVSGNITLLDLHSDITAATTVLQKKYTYYYTYPDGRVVGPYFTNSPYDYPCTHWGNTACGVGYENVSVPTSINGPAPSVLRTGTGNLDLLAGGSFNEQSLYGVYTAGTQSAPVLVNGTNPYNQSRGTRIDDGTLAGFTSPEKSAADALLQAWYPEDGGNLFLSAQGDVSGHMNTVNNTTIMTDSDIVAGWLWRQGGGGLATQPTAWSINFGQFMDVSQYDSFGSNWASVVGFNGIGTLGGGNLTVTAGRNAGAAVANGSILDLAVASTGRVLPDGSIVETGGGDLTLKVGGTINPGSPTIFFQGSPNQYGVITDLRGDIDISAGAYGAIQPATAFNNTNNFKSIDPRAPDPNVGKFTDMFYGPSITPGDGTVKISTRGDLAMQGVGDATTESAVDNGQTGLPYDIPSLGLSSPNGGQTSFTLWTPKTAISLFSAGGAVMAGAGAVGQGSIGYSNTELGFYPGSLTLIAQNGDLRFAGGGKQFDGGQSIELLPSPDGQLELLAAGSIFGSGQVVAMSGAAMDSLATPLHPAFQAPALPQTLVPVTNASPGAPYSGGNYKSGTQNPIAFGPDTPTGALHAGDDQPALVYAGKDIDDLVLGQVEQQSADFFHIFNPTITTWYIAAKPFDVVAGRDIVGVGQLASDTFQNLNNSDITEVHAGRDIYFQSITIAGPGLLDIQAGRNITQGYQGVLESVGPQYDIDPTNPSTGAGITVAAGVGANGPDYADFAKLYFDAANQLPGNGTPLAGSGKVVHAYDQELLQWLQQRFGYSGTSAGALAYFLSLPSDQQGVFVRQVYYEELTAGGREYNDPTSSRFQSYLRGRDAIATLFPTQDAQGHPITYTGDLTMFSGVVTNGSNQKVVQDAGVRTDFGGDIQILNPAGQTVLGVEGVAPGPGAGLLTQGTGDIDIYSEGSILLGQSRILTTFGGGILAWSATGDINSGRGSKTTVLFTPPRRVYNAYGEVTISPSVPSSGAGIGTLNPIPQVPPGNVDLIAPLGTVDAGEAGIRVSGNLNIAALHVVNAANIQVQGTATGLPQAVSVNTGALTAASHAATAVTAIADQIAERARPEPPPEPPSIIYGRFLGFGED